MSVSVVQATSRNEVNTFPIALGVAIHECQVGVLRMAPEYVPFVSFVGLAVVAIIALGVGIVLLLMPRHNRQRRRALRISSMAAFSTAGVVLLMLLALGAMIRQQFFLNEPFVGACAQGDLAEAQRLLAKGASPDAYGVDFIETALIAASRAGHREIVVLLLRSGANVELQDSRGNTAVQWAKTFGHSDIVCLLEQAGAGRRGNQAEEVPPTDPLLRVLEDAGTGPCPVERQAP